MRTTRSIPPGLSVCGILLLTALLSAGCGDTGSGGSLRDELAREKERRIEAEAVSRRSAESEEEARRSRTVWAVTAFAALAVLVPLFVAGVAMGTGAGRHAAAERE